MSGEKKDPGGRNEMAGLSVMFSPAVERKTERLAVGKAQNTCSGGVFWERFTTDGLYLMMRWASKHEKILIIHLLQIKSVKVTEPSTVNEIHTSLDLFYFTYKF